MASDLERQTRQIGRRLFALARKKPHGLGGWWDRQLMELGMRDERVEGQLFRFIDVLPALRSPVQINRMAREYLEPVDDRLPRVLAETIRRLPDDGRIGRWTAELAASNVRR